MKQILDVINLQVLTVMELINSFTAVAAISD